MERTSKISGFYKIPPQERLKAVKEFAGLTDEEAGFISATGALKYDQLDRMVENVIGTIEVPLGVAVNFLINGKDYLIPMAIEEPSVIAGGIQCSQDRREKGGFATSSTGPIMRGMIQVTGVKDPYSARFAVLSAKDKILEICNAVDPILVKFGGGCKDVEAYVKEVPNKPNDTILVVHLIVDCRDAMGANAVNTMAEFMAPHIEKLTGGKVYLRIISNLADKRLMRARAIFPKESIGGEDVVDGIIKAYEFALVDKYRADSQQRHHERHQRRHVSDGQRHQGHRGGRTLLRIHHRNVQATHHLREERGRRPGRNDRASAGGRLSRWCDSIASDRKG